MAKRKTTLYIDDEILMAAKVTAAVTRRTESALVEDALRAYLGVRPGQDTGTDLQDLMRRLAERHRGREVSEDAAMRLAVEEVRAVRAQTRSGRSQ